ncbi:MAG: hypothetical protein PHE27_01220 [Alphaproteobacteria bacterium]|nr:hypothetical protein [Alphaproteobacteria bacterium]
MIYTEAYKTEGQKQQDEEAVRIRAMTERGYELEDNIRNIQAGPERVKYVASLPRPDQIMLLTYPDVIGVLAQSPTPDESDATFGEAQVTVALINEQKKDVVRQIVFTSDTLKELVFWNQEDAVRQLIRKQKKTDQPFLISQVVGALVSSDPKEAFSLIKEQNPKKQAPLWIDSIRQFDRYKDKENMGPAIIKVLENLPFPIQKGIVSDGMEVAHALASMAPKEFTNYMLAWPKDEGEMILNAPPSNNAFSSYRARTRDILSEKGYGAEVNALYTHWAEQKSEAGSDARKNLRKKRQSAEFGL